MSNDTEWDVWDVRPQARPGSVFGGMEDGWLCFQSGTTRRRLYPVPADWADLEDEELGQLLQRARDVRASPVAKDRAGTEHARPLRTVSDRGAGN